MKKLKFTLMLVAFFSAPLLVGVTLTASSISEYMVHKEPPPIEELPQFTHGTSSKPVAWILISNSASEVSELLTSYGVLASSGAFQVYTVAPERRLSATTGDLAILPDFTFSQAPKPDLLVIPATVDSTQESLIEGVSLGLKNASFVLTLGEGARTLAHTISVENRTLSTHFVSLPSLEKEFPHTHWQALHNFTKDQNWISSGGIYASLFAEISAASQFGGEPLAQAIGQKIGLPGLDSRDASLHISLLEYLQLLLHASYDWEKPNVAIWVYPGISEIGLAGFIDTLPRTFSHHVTTVFNERKIIKTENGLSLVPAQGFAELSHVDDFVIPAGAVGPLAEPVVSRLTSWGTRMIDASKTPPADSFSKALLLISQERPDVTPLVAKMVRFGGALEKADRSELFSSRLLWARPVLVGLLASLLIFFLMRRSKPSV